MYRDFENETETREIPDIKSGTTLNALTSGVCVCVFFSCLWVCLYVQGESEREREREREQREIATEGEEEVILKRCYMKFRIIYS